MISRSNRRKKGSARCCRRNAGIRTICFVVCPNGLGHLARVCRLIEKIRLYSSGISYNLITSKAVFFKGHHLIPADVHCFPVFEGYSILATPPSFSAFRALAGLEQIVKADLVISDNLAPVLEVNPDAILSGSFLWHEVYINSKKLNESQYHYAEKELELLDKYRPVMLTVSDLTTQAVLAKTRAVPLPWLCDSQDQPEQRNRLQNLLIALGSTGILSTWLQQNLAWLANNEDLNFYVPRRELEGLNLASKVVFPFDYQNFAAMDAVICRPGAGALTDAVKFQLPVYAIYDENYEMHYNALAAEKLGIARAIGRPDANLVLAEIRDYRRWRKMKEAFKRLATGGLDTAAQKILEILG